MNNAPCLRDLQLWVKWIVTDPRGVSEALEDPRPQIDRYRIRYTEPTESQIKWIEGNAQANMVGRLNIYAEGYFSRILECFAKDFSRTKIAIGEDAFTKLVAEYLKAYPSKFTSIDEVGYRFANFIYEFIELSIPGWISDLALFEWKWLVAFYAKQVSAGSNWQNKFPTSDELRLKVHPSVSLIKSEWPLARIIRTLDNNGSLEPDYSKAAHAGIIVYHTGSDVLWEELETPLFCVLESLKEGNPLEESLMRVQDIDPDIVSKSFSHWVEKGILHGVLKDGDEL